MGTVRLFRQYIPISYILLMVLELCIFVASLFLGVMFGMGISLEEIVDYFEPLAVEAVFFAMVMLLSLASVGLYQRRLKEGRSGMVLRIITGVVVGVLVIDQLSYTIPDLDMGNSVWLSVVGIAFLGVFLARMILFRALSSAALKRKILVLGAGERACKLKGQLKDFGNYAYELSGFIPLPNEELGVSSNLVLALSSDLLGIVKEREIDEIVIAVDNKQQGFPTEALLQCKLFGVSVVDIVSFYEREAGKIMIDWISPSWFIFADGFQRGPWMKRAKRVSDIVLSALLGIIAAPLILMTMFAVWFEGKGQGPVLFKQIRVGENGKNFKLLKFRSMQVDAEKNGPQWASENDDRVTIVGRFIRKTRLDELPQLWNVFKGEMSFVGPRPERPEFVINLEKEIPFYQERHAVKPGITGWAQVCYPYASSIEDAYNKLQFDLYYVKNYSLFLDFVILLQTLEVVLWRRGAR